MLSRLCFKNYVLGLGLGTMIDYSNRLWALTNNIVVCSDSLYLRSLSPSSMYLVNQRSLISWASVHLWLPLMKLISELYYDVLY